MEAELKNFYNGYSIKAYNYFGAHLNDKGVTFRLFAPNAKSVRLMGEFNNYAKDTTFLTKNNDGIWEITIPGLKKFAMYKYGVEDQNGVITEKADPFGFYNELRPGWVNKVIDLDYKFTDEKWMKNRSRNFDKPLNIYEVHFGGFRIKDRFKWYTYYEMIDILIPYVKSMGYTHIELLPLNEHPFDGSWGYQQYGYFSVTSRYGACDQLQMFVDACHNNGIGVIMDVVLAHFVKDNFGLARFDGTNLYEPDNPSIAETSWGTHYFDFGKPTVLSFLMSSAGLWLDKYHMDGLRVDAVSNLIYFHGNKALGENKAAISFIKRLNFHLHEAYPTAMLIAEDSSDYPGVTKPTVENGLGFDYKWDLGWMNDTLKYYAMDPEFRKYHHNLINWSMAYFYNEKYILPFSHDEVVHSKKTIVDKMWGSYEEKFAQCRNLMVYLYTHPGKKLSFMGNEIGTIREFDEAKELDWFLLKYPIHDAFKRMIEDLNKIYMYNPAMYKDDYKQSGFKWIDADNNNQRIYSYIRFELDRVFVVVLNMAPISYEEFTIGVPVYGYYTEIMNSEKDIYGGCNMCNFKRIRAKKPGMHGYKYSMSIRLAPYGAVIFEAKIPQHIKK